MSKYVNFNGSSNTKLMGGENVTGFFNKLKRTITGLNVMTIVLILASVTIVSVLLYVYFSKQSPSYKPNSEHMPHGSNEGKTAELLFFYANWCPHCKSAKPIWDDLKAEYENKTIHGYHVVFTEIDCSTESAEVEEMTKKYNIEGFPTIKLLKDGQIIEYDAKPSKETLTQFLNTAL